MYPTLRPDFFPALLAYDDRVGIDSEYEGHGGWSPHLPGSNVFGAGTCSSQGPINQDNLVYPSSSGTDTPAIDL